MPFRNPFRSGLTTGQLMAGGVALIVDQMVELGRYTVPAGTGLSLGWGKAEGQDSAAGRAFINIANAGGAVNGLLRIDVENPQRRVVRTLLEGRTERFRTTNISDPTTQIPLPKADSKVGPGFSIVLRMQGDAVATPTVANSVILIDATTYDYSVQ